jgi:hypothetical protein
MSKDISFLKTSLLFLFFFSVSLLIRLNYGYDSSIWLDEAWRITIARSYNFENWQDIWKYALSFEGLLRLNDLLLSNNIDNYRIIFVVIASLTAPLTFVLSKKFLNTKLSFIVAIIIATSSWHITYSNEIAAYGVGASFIALLSILLFSEKVTVVNLFLLALVGSFLGLLHPYLIGLTLLLFTSKFLSDFIYTKNRIFLYKLFLLIFCVLIINSGQIYNRFFEFSGSEAFNIKLGLGWVIGFPIQLANLILSGPLINRWIPSSYDVGIFAMIFSTLIGFIFLIAIIRFCFLILRKENIQNLIKSNQYLSALLFSTISYVGFIYLQAFFIHGAFLRYILPAFPLILICLFYISEKAFKEKNLYLGIGLAMIIINISVLLNGNFSTHFKNPYKKIFYVLEEECAEKNVYIITPSFLELSIVNFYLEDSQCNLIIQPSFNKFFIEKQKHLAWQNDTQTQLEDNFLIEKALADSERMDKLIILGDRSRSRINEIIDKNYFKNFNEIDDEITNLGFRIIALERIE